MLGASEPGLRPKGVDHVNYISCIDPMRVYVNGAPAALPCRICTNCLRAKQMHWANRIEEERKASSFGALLTLTYAPLNLPSASYRDVQLFLKRLRKHGKVRFLAQPELGARTARFHWHLFLTASWNLMSDARPTRRAENGVRLFDNPHWLAGFSDQRPVHDENGASYVAKYITKSKSRVRCSRGYGTGADGIEVSPREALTLDEADSKGWIVVQPYRLRALQKKLRAGIATIQSDGTILKVEKQENEVRTEKAPEGAPEGGNPE